MHPDRESTRLPPEPRRGRDWGAVVAKLFCFVFALIGVLPVAAGAVVRSVPARRWAVQETTRLLRQQGIVATYQVELKLWPLAVELTNLAVASGDRGGPALTSPRASVRPRVFALLSGKLAIDQIEVDAPHVRAVLKDGQLANLGIVLPKGGKGGPFHAPFSVFSIADASLDLDIDGTKIDARELDVDVTTDDDLEKGSSFEIAVRAGETNVTRERVSTVKGKELHSFDDDALCGVDARVRIEPDLITVRRLNATGSADLDVAAGSGPGCHLPPGDKRNVELALSHLRVRLPPKSAPGKPQEDRPQVDGHVKARLPLGLAERFVHLPETDGWLGVDVDVRYAEDTVIPDVGGHFEAHGIRIDHFSFAQEIQSDVAVREGIVTSPLTVVHVAEGTATFSDTVIDIAKGATLKTKLDIKDVDFTSLLRDLGVHPHPYVGWDLHEIHVPSITGTLLPLHLDGDFWGNEGGFEVDDMPHENPAHQRIFATREAQLHAHLSVRPYGVEFKAVQVKLPKSTLENGFVALHFNNDLRVEVPAGKIDLSDCTPLGTIPIAGQVDVEAHVTGNFGDPHLEADATVRDFVFGDVPFGNITAGHASLTGLVLDLKNVRAQKGKSAYEMPTARLDFSQSGMRMDAQFASTALGLRDFLAIWRMEEDPRFLDLDASLATHGRLRVALGGPEDVCGNGFFDVHATAHATGVDLYGELFDEGDADFEYRWTDRLAGIEGADVDIHAFTLHKAKTRTGPIQGAVLGSGTIARGGDITANLVLQAIPLSRVQTLGPFRDVMEGTLSGTLQMGGKLDAYTLRGDVDVTPVRVRGAVFGPSHLVVGMTQDAKPARRVGKTRCGAPIYAPFDRDAYLRDASSQGHYEADGDLFGGQIHLDHVTMTRQRAAQIAGTIGLSQLDVAKVVQAVLPRDDSEAAPESGAIDGQLSGSIVIDRLVTSDLSNAKVRFVPGLLTVTRAGQRIVLRPTKDTITLAADTLTLPPLTLDLQASGGLKGAFVVVGAITHLSRSPELAISAQLEPIDLGVLVGVVPKLERLQGTLSGKMNVKGKAAQPQVAGELHIKGGELAVHGWPSDVSDVNVDAVADSQELRITHGSAKFAGGTLAVSGSMPLKRLAFDKVDATIAARDIHITPSPGVTATLDADLNVAWNAQATGSPTAGLPHVGGEVLINSFEYTRPINLELNAFGVRSKRTDVETYDPSLDRIAFDSVRVRSRAPLKIHNNLVEVQLAIDSGAMAVSGTDQRIGLRGELRAQPGGRFHLRANDFDVRQAIIRFDDPTRISANVDLLAVTEYRRYTDTSAGAAAGGTGGGGLWRISLHAYGDTENLRFEMTSDPPLSQEDIVLLITIGMTRAEIDQLQAGSLGTSLALEALATVSGADRAVKTAIPVIDDFRFGSAYSTVTGRTEPQVIVGKRLTDNLRANVATTLAEDREIRSNIEWRLNRRVSVQGSYDNINDISSSAIGNVGVDFRWRLEFE
jgi:translocation and assembly module TamB